MSTRTRDLIELYRAINELEATLEHFTDGSKLHADVLAPLTAQVHQLIGGLNAAITYTPASPASILSTAEFFGLAR